MKEEKFPYSRKPSQRWFCGGFCNLRRQHNWGGGGLKNASLAAAVEKRTFP